MLHQRALSAARLGLQAQYLAELVVARLQPGGLAHVDGAPIATLHRQRHEPLHRQGVAQRGSARIDALRFEFHAHHVHKVCFVPEKRIPC